MSNPKEEHRDARGLPWLETVVQDLRYAGRVLRREYVFSGFTVAIIAVGITAAAVVFSIVNSLLVHPFAASATCA